MKQATAHRPPGAAIDLLVLPDLATLSEEQVRGITCVWDGVALRAGAAVDLGPRTAGRAGADVQWFPRGCRHCAGQRAYHALFDHASECEHCLKQPTGCAIGDELRRLARGARL
ncbi:hypothetical protein AAW14_24835 [Streptomyces hygroscopicus]|uniref:hypothetical protein n=1 Tax=Streptomyces hygroscopicus TaxID=1912 RepID=UPI00223F6C2C|nr:hypothetical protein [Streptomyces hygroscopicus]MCW7945149.1 hypothetical protein [Streptomyces hygroscopicus]